MFFCQIEEWQQTRRANLLTNNQAGGDEWFAALFSEFI